MMQQRTYRQTPGQGAKVLRVMLALLLTLSPLLATAQVAAPAPANVADAASHLPCHPDSGQALPATDDDHLSAAGVCPHCTGDATASQCHCCGYAAPAGLSTVPDTPATVPGAAALRLALAPDSLPESPRDDLFRPPISAS